MALNEYHYGASSFSLLLFQDIIVIAYVGVFQLLTDTETKLQVAADQGDHL